MAYKEAEVKYDPTIKWEEADEKEGVFLGKNIEGKLVDTRKVIIGGKEATVWSLIVGDVRYDMWGSTVLNGRLKSVPMNSMVKISYLGKKKGKQIQPFRDFMVEYDDDGAEAMEVLGGKEVKNKEEEPF